MVQFFRRIRRNLLNKNPPGGRAGRFGNYVLYAIGEIILVVIGILIALQINTWNEDIKVDKSIVAHLAILKQNLLEDQVQLKQLGEHMTYNIHYADSALRQMQTLLPVDNKIKKYLVKLILEYQFSPNMNAMETITQSNEIPSLKPGMQTAILNYYALIERTREREHISNTQIQTKYENHINNEYAEIFQKDNDWEFMAAFYKNDPRTTSPVSGAKLRADRRLEALLVSRYFQSTELQGFYNSLLVSSEAIMKLLEEQLNEESP